jgi:hypothetical protein
MAVTIDWGNKIINVYQSDLTLIQGSLYELDTEWFRLQLKALEESEEGMAFLDTHRHATEVTISGVTYARFIEIINGYQVQFLPNSHYTVRLVGSNNNIPDVKVLSEVSIVAQNSAGLVVAGNMTPTAMWSQELETGFTAEELMKLMAAALAGKLSGAASTTITIRSVDDSKTRITATVDADGNRTSVVTDTS